jgi:DNA-binding Lrp family transcriptional regulator
VDWSRVTGNWIGFVLQIKVAFDKITEVAKLLAQLSEVRSLYRTTEEYLLLGFIWVQNIPDFNRFLLKCYDIPGVEDTQSLLMLAAHLERSPVTVFKLVLKK